MEKEDITVKCKLILKSFADIFDYFRRSKNVGVDDLATRSIVSSAIIYTFIRDAKNITLKSFIKLLEGLDLCLYDVALKCCPYDKETMYRLLDEEWEFRESGQSYLEPPRERASKRKK